MGPAHAARTIHRYDKSFSRRVFRINGWVFGVFDKTIGFRTADDVRRPAEEMARVWITTLLTRWGVDLAGLEGLGGLEGENQHQINVKNRPHWRGPDSAAYSRHPSTGVHVRSGGGRHPHSTRGFSVSRRS